MGKRAITKADRIRGLDERVGKQRCAGVRRKQG